MILAKELWGYETMYGAASLRRAGALLRVYGGNSMLPIETERLTIRQFVAGDWAALHGMIVQYQASEYAAYDQTWPTSPEEIKGVAEWFASGEQFLAVCLRDTGQFIGFVSLNLQEGDACRKYDLGYCFSFDHHGRGYATEACRAVLGRAFGELQAGEVTTGTAAANGPSCRLLERLGFEVTGEGMTSFRNGPDGKPIEFLGYAMALSREKWEGAGGATPR